MYVDFYMKSPPDTNSVENTCKMYIFEHIAHFLQILKHTIVNFSLS